MRPSSFLIGLVFMILPCVFARPTYVSLIPNGANIQVQGSTVAALGHVEPAGGGTRNSFGIDFDNGGRTWTTDLCQRDSDGDGFTNGYELGDPDCVWTPGATPQRTTALSHPGLTTSVPVAPTCTSVSYCNNRSAGVPYLVGIRCKCGCRNNWRGENCNKCPTGITGDCDVCPEGTIKPKCTPCTVDGQCSGSTRAKAAYLSSDQTRCVCACANRWSGRNCSVCPSPYSGDQCNMCAAGKVNYPACTDKDPDVPALTSQCTTKCVAASCANSTLVSVGSRYVCSCGSCPVTLKTRVCSTTLNKPCMYPTTSTCATVSGEQRCVVNTTSGPTWTPCGKCP